jgi:hypothetical protein
MSGRQDARASEPPQQRERAIERPESPEAIAVWACEAASDLGGRLPEPASTALATVAGALTADALTRGRPPLSIRVTVTATAVQVAVTDARSIAHRTLSYDEPALVQARRLASSWQTRLGPGGRVSVVTATVPLRRGRRRLPWRRRRGGR